MATEDYGFCEDERIYFDLWRYGDIESSGHGGHKWRHVNDMELRSIIKEDLEDGYLSLNSEDDEWEDRQVREQLGLPKRISLSGLRVLWTEGRI